MYKYIRTIKTGEVPNKTYVGDDSSGLIAYYNIDYNGATLKLGALKSIDQFTELNGPAKLFFNNIPEQGIEKNAFYDSLGYESYSTGRRAQGSTGMTDEIFGMPIGTYKYAQVSYDVSSNDYRSYAILLTPGPDMGGVIGVDDIWYIYPDSYVDLN